MARNPKQDANLKPIKKGELSKEEAKKRGSKGGKKSAESRKNKRDAQSAARYMLELAAKGQLKSNLVELGVADKEQSNMVALQARLFTMAMSGNLAAYQQLMKIAGYEPEENRKERESLSSEKRRDMEVEAKINALGGGVDGADVAVNTTDEDGNNDVVVYIPKMMDEEECEIDEKDDKSESTKEETPDE